MTKGKLYVLSGPSGVGKSTAVHEVMSRHPTLRFSVSVTTREIRPGEVEGESYYFISRQQFRQMLENDELLEHAEYVGNCYGTPEEPINRMLEQGIDVLLDIEVQGAAKVKAKCPEAVSIFIIPPSLEELSRRLHHRNTDDEDVIASRLQTARAEYQEIPNYDYLVVNDNVTAAAEEIMAILTAESCRVKNRLHLIEGV